MALNENNFKKANQGVKTYKTNKPKQSKTKQNKEAKPLDLNIFPRHSDMIKSELFSAYKLSKLMPLTLHVWRENLIEITLMN